MSFHVVSYFSIFHYSEETKTNKKKYQVTEPFANVMSDTHCNTEMPTAYHTSQTPSALRTWTPGSFFTFAQKRDARMPKGKPEALRFSSSASRYSCFPGVNVLALLFPPVKWLSNPTFSARPPQTRALTSRDLGCSNKPPKPSLALVHSFLQITIRNIFQTFKLILTEIDQALLITLGTEATTTRPGGSDPSPLSRLSFTVFHANWTAFNFSNANLLFCAQQCKVSHFELYWIPIN